MRLIYFTLAAALLSLLSACTTQMEGKIASNVSQLVKENTLDLSKVDRVDCLKSVAGQPNTVCSVVFHSSDRADVFTVSLGKSSFPNSFKAVFRENSGYLTADEKVFLYISGVPKMTEKQAAEAIYADIAESVTRTREKLSARK